MTNNKINYSAIIERSPWIIARNQSCILSPDVDGLLCGLLMSSFLNWKIVGFYDGKNLLIGNNVSPKNAIFLDMEILRKDIKSIGHHLNVHNINALPDGYEDAIRSCINPNLIRKFDRSHSFAKKYPLGTIHLLMYVLENHQSNLVDVKKEGLASLFFADGVWKVLFKYTANVIDWFDFLHSGNEADWWSKLKTLSVIDLINEINDLLAEFRKIDNKDKNWYGHFDPALYEQQKNKLSALINYFSEKTGWRFNGENWKIKNPKLLAFEKKIYGQNNTGSKSNQKFIEIWGENPLSLAMTDGSTIQYTTDPENILS